MQNQPSDTESGVHINALINETSPYLLQHAHNPVNWYPWGEEALNKAGEEDKPIIVSIGYSACHWCHVMEHESFEDSSVAEIMNEHFISIKVDREERPDIDQVYMDAVQLMGQRGGWPLNVVTLPDGKPFFGGTYFPAEQWKNVLLQLVDLYQNQRGKVEEYAHKLTEGVQKNELVQANLEAPEFSIDLLDQTVDEWKKLMDNKEGGPNRAPKFALPNNYQFLLRYGFLKEDQEILDHVKLTLQKMAFGGIYDHMGGGFARYSTDAQWKVPHFEKMLYDNAQLVSLYSEAYQYFKDPLYKQVVYETLKYIKREMTSPDGAFYSALDADSEGEEGKFYVWKKEELKELLGENFELFAHYYNVNNKGLWEHGNYILLREKSNQEIAKERNISMNDLENKIDITKEILFKAREKREHPGLDDKSLTSWNALMLKGFIDAYRVFGDNSFLEIAIKNGEFILNRQVKGDNSLYHSYKNGRSTINGYLEDYSFTIEAFLSLYEATFDEKWLEYARKLTDYTITHFYNDNTRMFFFTSDQDEALIARKTEIMDNVIPASNSSLAKGLFLLGHFLDDERYLEKSSQMLNNIQPQISTYGSGYSNWAQLLLYRVATFYEIAIVGKDANIKRDQISRHYYPFALFTGSKDESDLPLLNNKFVEGKTMIYVCVNKSCKLPVEDPGQAIQQITRQ